MIGDILQSHNLRPRSEPNIEVSSRLPLVLKTVVICCLGICIGTINRDMVTS